MRRRTKEQAHFSATQSDTQYLLVSSINALLKSMDYDCTEITSRSLLSVYTYECLRMRVENLSGIELRRESTSILAARPPMFDNDLSINLPETSKTNADLELFGLLRGKWMI